MTDEQLRTVNALVAERVMGWRWQVRVGTRDLWCFPPDRPLLAKDRSSCFNKYYCGPVGDFEFTELTERESGWFVCGKRHEDLPKYSSDWSAAGEVVEKMVEDHPEWRFGLLWGARMRPSAEFFDLQDGERVGEDVRETVPLVICHAALRAVGAGHELDAILKEIDA